MEKNKVYVGIFADSSSLCNLSVNSGYIYVENGRIAKTGSLEEFEQLNKSELFAGCELIKLNNNQLIIPGFVDCHTHAPQFPNIGLGLDRPLLEWLAMYTFPLEKKYSDTKFASRVYDQVVQTLLKNGTTTTCYFGSLHKEGTMELVKSAIKYRQRALIGKVSMNKHNDAGYYNDTEKELAEVDTFVQEVLAYKNELVEPVVTPRFAVSCDKKLMNGLSKIAQKYNCRIQRGLWNLGEETTRLDHCTTFRGQLPLLQKQHLNSITWRNNMNLPVDDHLIVCFGTASHISENKDEIDYVLENNAPCASYGDVYEKSGILNDKCIMAHAVHLTNEEYSLLSSRRVSIAHCPASNTRLKSGMCPVRKILNAGITVGLGTDVAGGDNASILDAIRRTMDVSMCLELQGNPERALSWKEAFYLATLGGAKALNLDHKIGNFDVGKDFDALLIDVYAKGGQIDEYEDILTTSPEEYANNLLQRFIYLGDDRNIAQVFVKGENVKLKL